MTPTKPSEPKRKKLREVWLLHHKGIGSFGNPLASERSAEEALEQHKQFHARYGGCNFQATIVHFREVPRPAYLRKTR